MEILIRPKRESFFLLSLLSKTRKSTVERDVHRNNKCVHQEANKQVQIINLLMLLYDGFDVI